MLRLGDKSPNTCVEYAFCFSYFFAHSDEQTPSKDSQSPDGQKETEEQTNAKSATQVSTAAAKGSYSKSSQLDQVCVLFSSAPVAAALSGEL